MEILRILKEPDERLCIGQNIRVFLANGRVKCVRGRYRHRRAKHICCERTVFCRECNVAEGEIHPERLQKFGTLDDDGRFRLQREHFPEVHGEHGLKQRALVNAQSAFRAEQRGDERDRIVHICLDLDPVEIERKRIACIDDADLLFGAAVPERKFARRRKRIEIEPHGAADGEIARTVRDVRFQIFVRKQRSQFVDERQNIGIPFRLHRERLALFHGKLCAERLYGECAV